ncbi:unnamed protein product [Effrenium voratum]|nr:unnamed protein product [Effrenium voratum]
MMRIVLLLLLIWRSSSAQVLYLLQNFPNRILRSNLEGQQQVVLAEGLPHPMGIAVDDIHHALYFGVSDDDSDRIMKLRLEDSKLEEVVTGVHAGGVAVDGVHGHLYWTELTEGRVMRSRLDGSHVQVLVEQMQDPGGIELDILAGRMYWCDQPGHEGFGRILSAGLDGSDVVTVTNHTAYPMDLAVDTVDGQLYWTDAGKFQIARAKLDGSQVEVLQNKSLEFNESKPKGRHITGLLDPHGIVLDRRQGKIYYTMLGTVYSKIGGPSQSRNARLQRSNLDGSDVETLAEFGPTQPVALAISFHDREEL